MRRKLPFRWIPAATMWKQGSDVPAIAEVYKLPPAVMKRRIHTLAEIYPREFPSRVTGTESSLSLKDRLASSLSQAGIVKKRPTPRHARGRAALRRAG